MLRTRRRRAADLMLTSGSVCTVVAGMAAIDENAREAIVSFLAGDHGVQVAALTGRTQGYSRLVVSTISGYHNEHAALLTFAVAALVLFIFMLRT
jgi:hypothetical protein